MKNIDVQVFVREEKPRSDVAAKIIAAKMVNDHLMDQTSRFLTAMQKAFVKRKMTGRLRTNPWPVPRNNGLSLIHCDSDMNYDYLNEDKYAGDIAVCVMPTIDYVDGAVGTLLLRELNRQRNLLHLCILTAEELPDYDKKPELYKGILALPTGIKKRGDCQFFEPLTTKNSDGSICFTNAAQARVLTIDSFPEINQRKIDGIADLLQFQKSA